MNHIHRDIATIVVILAVVISGCSRGTGPAEKQESDSVTATRSEHDRDGREHGREGRGEHARDRAGNEEGEESGTELALNETYDKVRNGARLILAYDAQSNSFKGTVENTTRKTLKRVRVEVHLSNGRELGPTTPADLGPGKKRDVKLTVTSNDFDGWSAHPEVGSEERERGEHGREGRAEHGGEGRGEHDGKGGSEHR